LENLFIYSEEVKKELPNETEAFIGIDKEVKDVLKNGKSIMNVLKFCTEDNIFERLEKVQE
jgi:dynein heavy chain